MGVRGLPTLLAPGPAIISELTASYPGGIGSGPGQLKLPENYGLVISPEAAATPGIQVAYSDPADFTKGGNFITDMFKGLAKALVFFGSPYTAAAKVGLEALKPEQVVPELQVTTLNAPGGSNMAFSDGDTGFSFDQFFGGVNQALQGGLGQQLLGIGTQALSGYVTQQFAPQPMSQPISYPSGPMAQPVMASVPALGRAGAVVARGFFNRFPNLATSLQALRNRGANVTRGTMYSALKRFGPEMLVSGGILTAAAVSELAVAGPGRRRMNPGNVKALRRAHRRMKSFHKVCVDNDQLYKRSKRK
jgi:hypothetical protein